MEVRMARNNLVDGTYKATYVGPDGDVYIGISKVSEDLAIINLLLTVLSQEAPQPAPYEEEYLTLEVK